MSLFTHSFLVNAPLAAVAAFHRDARALKQLSPPPMVVQLHTVEPLAEGSLAEFTLWLGPLPIRWRAIHSQVEKLRGFTDTQTRGPMRFWKHTHTFAPEGDGRTRVNDRVEYEHHTGWRGLFTRLVFAPLSLRFLFFYRATATRHAVKTA
jgi:ligand-binding SRPBCC domain-containing protein